MDSQLLFIPLRASAEIIGWAFILYALALGGKMLLYRGGDFVVKLWKSAGQEPV